MNKYIEVDNQIVTLRASLVSSSLVAISMSWKADVWMSRFVEPTSFITISCLNKISLQQRTSQ